MTEPTTPDPRDPENTPEIVIPENGAPGPDSPDTDIADDELGPGAFDTPAAAPAEEPSGESASEPSDETEKDPKKAYVGRPELTPLYAMAGVADLAAAMVRDIVNEQIAAYRARRAKEEPAAEDTPEDEAKDNTAQFNEFLTKAQQRTQEIFDQAVTQYEHLADRGRVAVGDILEAAKQQQKARQEAEAAEAPRSADSPDSPGSPDSPDSPDSPASPPSPTDPSEDAPRD